MPAGKSADNLCNSAYTVSATPKALAPGVRNIPSATAFWVSEYMSNGVVAGPKFHACHIGEMHDLAVRAIFEHNVTKLLLSAEAASHVDRDQKVGCLRRRLGAELACRHLHILLAHGVDHVCGGKTERGESVRVEPETHCLIAGTDHLDIANTRQAGQLVLNMQDHVVAQVQ